MIHSYNVDVALAVGGAPEAVVLKEVAYWCERNRDGGSEERDGRHWMFRSIREWQEEFPEYKGSIDNILSRLVRNGWIVTGNFNKNTFDRTKWYAPSDKSISLFARIDSAIKDDGFAQKDGPIPSGNTSGKQTAEEILKKSKAEIDRLYSLYPAKTETRDGFRSTGKCSKDKLRIAGLLKTHTAGQIEHSIKRYVEDQDGKYLKNFSTFLNNMPEYEDDAPEDGQQDKYAHYQSAKK